MENSKLISLQISPGSSTPIYRQLMEQIQRLVASKNLKDGEELPSVRVLAGQLAVNPMTISKAYSSLELQGILLRRRGKGMIVADNKEHQLGVEQRLNQLETSIERVLMEAQQLNITDNQVVNHIKRLLKRKQTQ